jgi:thioesterase domain-containing protein
MDRDKISIDANFFELGGHSLKAVNMVSKIHQAFDVKVPLIEIFKTPTIKDITPIIKEEEKATRIETDNNLVLIKRDINSVNHLFFIHDGYGEVEMYVEFCMNLNAGFNYWGIRADKIKDFAPREINLKDTAKNYIKKIKQVQPQGPYNIAGWSMGGLIAFEMIGQLERAGEHTRFFSIIDSASVPRKIAGKPGFKFTVKSEIEFVKKYLKDERIIKKLKQLKDINSLWSTIVAYFEEMNSKGEATEEVALIGNSMKIPYIKQNTVKEVIYFINMMRTFDNARNLYKPDGKLHTTLNYFKPTESNVGLEKWNRYFRNQVRSYEVTGDHFSIFKNPDFAGLFDKILK